MALILHLTDVSNGSPVYANVAHIRTICNRPNGTVVQVGEDTYIHVRETPTQILAQIPEDR